jgi:integrase
MRKNTTSDYVEFERAHYVASRLVEEKKIIGLYILVAIYTGLRIGDILKLKFQDFNKDTLVVIEGKTGKHRSIKINQKIFTAIEKFPYREGFIFKSQKNQVYERQSINRLLKKVFKKEAKTLNISSHSLRKSFGRQVYTQNGSSENSLVYLGELFNHSSLMITRRYLGIRQSEMDNIYLNL